MRKNKILPTIRIETELFLLMEKARQLINQSGLEINSSAFRRMAYKFFSEDCLANGLTINFKPK